MNVLPEKQKEVLQTLLSLIEIPGKEKGYLSYGIFCDIEDKNVFNLISEWETLQHLDYHIRGVIAQIDIPLIDSKLTNQHLSHYSVEEIRCALGKSVLFQQKRERHYIDEREKDDLLHGLMDSFIKRTLNYLSLPDFPSKYVLKEFQAYRKRKTWY